MATIGMNIHRVKRMEVSLNRGPNSQWANMSLVQGDNQQIDITVWGLPEEFVRDLSALTKRHFPEEVPAGAED